MNIDQVVSQAMKWLRLAVVIMMLASVVVILLRSFGVIIPVRTLGHIEMAYLAGVYWLTK